MRSIEQGDLISRRTQGNPAEDQPSTSRGGGSGLLRLVIPDSDSEAEVESPGSPRLEIDVTGTEPALSTKGTVQKEKDDNIKEKSSQIHTMGEFINMSEIVTNQK